MEAQLAGTDARWRLGVYHFPLYSLGWDSEYDAIRRRWEGVFAKQHLDMMLHGHVHYYLRTAPMRNGAIADSPAQGTVYAVSLALPGRTSDRKIDLPAFVEHAAAGGLWYQKIDIDGKRLVFRAYDADGKVCDEFVIEK